LLIASLGKTIEAVRPIAILATLAAVMLGGASIPSLPPAAALPGFTALFAAVAPRRLQWDAD